MSFVSRTSSAIRRRSPLGLTMAVGLIMLAGGASRADCPRGCDVLPASTRQFVSIPDAAALRAAFKKTELAKLFAQPGVAAVLSKVTRHGLDGLDFGLRGEEIEAAAGGEVGWAVFQRDMKHTARVFFINTTGKAEQAKRLVDGLPGRLEKNGFPLVKPAGGKAEIRYGTANHKERAYAFKDGLLICCDDHSALEGLLERWPGAGKDSLGQLACFKAVRQRCQEASKCPLQAFVYSTPIGLAGLRHPGMRLATSDLVVKYEQQGLAAIKAVGTGVCLANGPFELTYHIAIYAPGPRKNSMAMITFCPGKDFTPPAWVPCKLSACGTAYFDLCRAFENVGPLFDEVYGDGEKGTFKAVMKDLKSDPNGPQVDVQHDLIDHLGKRLTVVSDTDLKLGCNAVRSLVAIETNKPEAVNKALSRLLENDETVVRREFKHQVIWEIPGKKKKAAAGSASVRPPSSALCVAFGHLLLTNNIRLLERILTRGETSLATDNDYQRVQHAFARVAPASASMHTFTRPDLDYRVAYEALRKNRLGEVQSVYAMLLTQLLGNQESLGVDLSKLPAFDKVVPYLGPAGMYLVSGKDGWVVNGFLLPPRR